MTTDGGGPVHTKEGQSTGDLIELSQCVSKSLGLPNFLIGGYFNLCLIEKEILQVILFFCDTLDRHFYL